MKIRILLGALLLILVSAGAADAQRWHRGGGYYGHRGGGYYGGYRGGYGRSGVVVVTPPIPRVVVQPAYYGGGYYNDPYYNDGYYYGNRGYYGGRGYYGRGHYRSYGYRHRGCR